MSPSGETPVAGAVPTLPSASRTCGSLSPLARSVAGRSGTGVRVRCRRCERRWSPLPGRRSGAPYSLQRPAGDARRREVRGVPSGFFPVRLAVCREGPAFGCAVAVDAAAVGGPRCGCACRCALFGSSPPPVKAVPRWRPYARRCSGSAPLAPPRGGRAGCADRLPAATDGRRRLSSGGAPLDAQEPLTRFSQVRGRMRPRQDSNLRPSA